MIGYIFTFYSTYILTRYHVFGKSLCLKIASVFRRLLAQRDRVTDNAMVATRKAEREEKRYQDLQAVLQADTSERQAVLDTQIREMSSERAELVSQACCAMSWKHA